MSGPFKMKGSPMKRNFGIGASPAKQTEEMEKIPSIKAKRLPVSKIGRVMQKTMGIVPSEEEDIEQLIKEGQFKHTAKD